MKKILFLVCAIATMAWTTSCSDELSGDQTTVTKGKSDMLQLTVKGSKIKTKATQTDAFDGTTENNISEIIVFVFRSDGSLDVAPFTHSGTDMNADAGFTLDIPVTPNANNIYVAANLGDPLVSSTLANLLITAVNSAEGTAAKDALENFTMDLNEFSSSTVFSTGHLPQTTTSEVTLTQSAGNFTASAALQYVSSRIALEGLTVFGVDYVAMITADATGTNDEKGINDLGWSNFSISGIFVLNAPGMTSLVGEKAATVAALDASTKLYGGTTISTPSDNPAYYLADNSVLPDLIETPTTYPLTATNNPYFYVWANPTTGSAGTTLLVIAADVTLAGNSSATTMYYAVPVKTSGDDTLNRKTFYHITANINGAGASDPYEVLVNARITITPSAYDNSSINATFPIVPVTP